MGVECTVTADGDRLVAAVSGHLDVPAVPVLRLRLLKCLAEQPAALIVDLSGLADAEPATLALFPAVARQASHWPGIPVLLCAPPPVAARLRERGVLRRLPVIDGLPAARARADQDRRVLAAVRDDLLPIRGAARQARNVATDACLRWGLPDLVAPASLVADELVSNVVDHAGTMMTLRVTLRPRHVYVAVSDGSPDPPVAADTVAREARSGRGLLLVAATALHWGWLPTGDGKVVWAALARRPARRR